MPQVSKYDYVQEVAKYDGSTVISIASRLHPNMAARLAIDIASRFALLAAIPDGEDSAGRQRMRLPTPEELADRSIALADALLSRFEARGMLMELPEPQLPKDDATWMRAIKSATGAKPEDVANAEARPA